MRRQIIKESELKQMVKKINLNLGFTEEECEDRYYTPGSYRFESAYGGHRVVKVLTVGGCIETIPGMSGFDNKRDLYNKLRFFNPSK